MALSEKEINAKLDKVERELILAFLLDLERVGKVISYAEAVEAIAEEQIQILFDAYEVTAAEIATTLEVTRQTVMWGGTREVQATRVPRGVRFTFDIRDPVAERWLRRDSSTLVTRINEDMREVVRNVVAEGQERGQNPRRTATDLLGARTGASGRRSGGRLGLTPQMARYVANARAELEAGDAASLGKYLRRGRRDRRFDRLVRKAAREGKALTATQIDKLSQRYSERLLRLRAETIARTEALQALNRGRQLPYEQAIKRGEVNPDDITKTWKTSVDGRQRATHGAMHNQTVKFNAAFTSPSGAQLLHPGDSSLGAPGGEIINCRCVSQNEIDFFARLKR